MDWNEISKEKSLSIAFVKEHHAQLKWYDVNRRIILSKEFINTFPKELKWNALAMNPSLTTELLAEIKDYPFVNWDTISRYYPVTIDMYIQFNSYIDREFLIMNPYKKVEVEKTETPLENGKGVRIIYAVKEK